MVSGTMAGVPKKGLGSLWCLLQKKPQIEGNFMLCKQLTMQYASLTRELYKIEKKPFKKFLFIVESHQFNVKLTR